MPANNATVTINVKTRGLDQAQRKLKQINRTLNRIEGPSRRVGSQVGHVGKRFQQTTQKIKGTNTALNSTMRSSRGASGTLGLVASSAGAAGGSIGLLSGKLSSLSMGMALGSFAGMNLASTLGVMGGVLGGAAVVGAGAKAISTLASLEDTAIRAARSVGRTGEDARELISGFRELSRTAPVASVNQSADAVLKLVRSGVSLDKAMGSAGRTALSFAKIVEIPVSQAITQLQSAVNQTDRSFENISDIIIAASRETPKNIDAISAAMARGAKASRDLRLSVEQTAAIIAEGTAKGLSGREVGTALRRASTFANRLGTAMQTARQTEAISALGIENTAEAFAEGRANLLDLIEAAERAGTTSAELGGILGEAGGKLADTLRGATDDVRAFGRELQGAEGTTRDSARALEESLGGTLADLGNSFGRLTASFGTFLDKIELIDAFQRGIESLTTAVDKLAGAFDRAGTLAQKLFGLTPSEKTKLDTSAAEAIRDALAGGVGNAVDIFANKMSRLVVRLNRLREERPVQFGIGAVPRDVRARARELESMLATFTETADVDPSQFERLSDALQRMQGMFAPNAFLQVEPLFFGGEGLVRGTPALEELNEIAKRAKQSEALRRLFSADPLGTGFGLLIPRMIDLSQTSQKTAKSLSLAEKALNNFTESVKSAVQAQKDQPQDLQGFLNSIFEGFVNRTAQTIQSTVTRAIEGTQFAKSVASVIGTTGSQIAGVLGGLASAGFVTFAMQGVSIIAKEMARIRREFLENQKLRAARRGVPTGVFSTNRIPQAASGGFVEEGGLVRVHDQEVIRPARLSKGYVGAASVNVNNTITLNVDGSGSPEETADAVRETFPLLSDDMERRVRQIIRRELGSSTIRSEGLEAA